MERAKKRGLRIQPGEQVVFVVGQEIVLSGDKATWFHRGRRSLYGALNRNVQTKIDYYKLPHLQTLEMSIHILLDDSKEA
ncbi:hypothetical protein HKX48_001447 [Thoreauomyces humboldtii]|nr:hypothetical protein HKX48_001447 [Thoreauomyces humboldtii]